MKYTTAVMRDPKGYLTINELKKLFEVARKSNFRDFTLLFTTYKSGRRVSEVLNLTRDDIDFENNKILWSILKRRNPVRQWFDADPELLEVLKRYIQLYKIEPHEKLFKITRQRVFQIMRKRCEEAGIFRIGGKKPHIHHLRHSFAVHYVQSVKPTIESIRTLQMYMGHANINSTFFYLQFAKDIYTEQLKKMPKMLKLLDE